jgi:ribose-phosphate pyrophosphokinase
MLRFVPMLIASTEAYKYLQDEVLALMPSASAAQIEHNHFPDGETYHRFSTNITNQHIVIIGGTIDDANTLELYDLAVGASQNGAAEISLVMPYFGYSTMERMVYGGEVVKAQSRALLFSAIPSVRNAIEVFLFDLHSEGIPYYFDRHIRTHHVYCKPVILEAARQFGGNDFVLASTDAGRAKWVESLALELGVPSAFAYKQRVNGEETKLSGINADVQGKHVIIYDDMIRTGGSLISCAQAYKQHGAASIDVITTHGLFSNNAMERIKASGLIERVACTNSHPNAIKADVKCFSVANLIVSSLSKYS